MKTIKSTFVSATIILLASAFTFSHSFSWKIKDDYSVKFSGKKVEGIFKGLKANINFNPADLNKSTITATIDATTANTGNGMMNKHAKCEEGLNTAKFPDIIFESRAITKTSTGFEALGKLTLKGLTKEIKLPFTFSNDIFSGQFTVLPKAYGITRAGTPSEITVSLVVPVSK